MHFSTALQVLLQQEENNTRRFEILTTAMKLMDSLVVLVRFIHVQWQQDNHLDGQKWVKEFIIQAQISIKSAEGSKTRVNKQVLNKILWRDRCKSVVSGLQLWQTTLGSRKWGPWWVSVEQVLEGNGDGIWKDLQNCILSTSSGWCWWPWSNGNLEHVWWLVLAMMQSRRYNRQW